MMSILQKKTFPLLCLMGPTAAGKSQVALALAEHLPISIISVDSAMVYKRLDIGTAKPSASELAATPHYLINICEPTLAYSVGQFIQDTSAAIIDIQEKNRIPLLVGGTMLYFYQLQHGLAVLPAANPQIRTKLIKQALAEGWSALHAQLQQVDKVAAARIHPQDGQRIGRALEVYYSTGKPISQHQAEQIAVQRGDLGGADCPFFNIILQPKCRADLHRHIQWRLDHMLAQGLLEEVEALHQEPALHADLPALRSVGYRQIWAYLDGAFDKQAMYEKTLAATRQLAKRQLTWLRRWSDALMIESDRSIHNVIKRVLEACKPFLN